MPCPVAAQEENEGRSCNDDIGKTKDASCSDQTEHDGPGSEEHIIPECPSGDASPVCRDEVMMRYCVVPSYFKLCCKACDHMKEQLIFV